MKTIEDEEEEEWRGNSLKQRDTNTHIKGKDSILKDRIRSINLE